MSRDLKLHTYPPRSLKLWRLGWVLLDLELPGLPLGWRLCGVVG